MHAYASPDIELVGGGTIDCMGFKNAIGQRVLLTIDTPEFEPFAHLTPARARQLAAYLIEAADAAERRK